MLGSVIIIAKIHTTWTRKLHAPATSARFHPASGSLTWKHPWPEDKNVEQRRDFFIKKIEWENHDLIHHENNFVP